MAGSRDGWQLKEGLAKKFKAAFGKNWSKLGISNRSIASGAGVDINIVNRLFRRETIVSGEDIHKLFDSIQREPGQSVEDAIDEYCDMVIKEETETSVKTPASVRTYEKPGLTCMTSHCKLIYLRNFEARIPAYSRHVPRLGKEVEVYDEFLVHRVLSFRKTPAPFIVLGRRQNVTADVPGLDIVTDLQPVYPPRHDVFPRDESLVGYSNLIEHWEQEHAKLWHGSFTMLNGFQRGNEIARLTPIQDCDRGVLMVDLTSVFPYDNKKLLIKPPTGHHCRSGRKENIPMQVEETSRGVFLIDSYKAYEGSGGWDPNQHVIKEGDQLQMQFSINWDIL